MWQNNNNNNKKQPKETQKLSRVKKKQKIKSWMSVFVNL